MGSWLIESLCLEYEVAAYDNDLTRLRYFFNTTKLTTYDEIRKFNPDIVINAVSLQYTVPVFREIIPYLNRNCILADITSVKNGLSKFYPETGFRFVSTHPMFGPTFANLRDLTGQSAIIISESDEEGKEFFRNFFESFNLKIFEYTFVEHDETIAYSLSIPFASTMVFAAVMKKQDAPGTTFRKHLEIARGLFSEDDFLLTEILFSPFTLEQLDKISSQMDYLRSLIREKDETKLREFLGMLRRNIH